MTVPELPEVETVKNVTAPQICGRRIERVALNRRDVIAHPAPDDFVRLATGRAVTGMGRRGKFLRFFLDDGAEMVLHLRMTGRLLAVPPEFPAEKHTHVVFSLSGRLQLRFADMRRFGRFWLLRKGEKDCTGMNDLGLEPFDAALTPVWLKERLGASRRAVKTCLLDQSVVAGIGNIYSDEILFAARIRPTRAASSLSRPEWGRLARSIREVMRFHVEQIDVSAEEFLRGRGTEYRNTPLLKVYGRDGDPCPVCGATLQRAVVGGRSSVFCPRCQKRRETKVPSLRQGAAEKMKDVR